MGASNAQIIHTERNGKVYANIASIMGLPKSMAIKGTVNPFYKERTNNV